MADQDASKSVAPPPAPKPPAPPPQSLSQKLAAAINADAQRVDALAASRQSESAQDRKMRQAAAAQPAAPSARPGTPAPKFDDWIRSPEFQRSLGSPQPAAAEIAPTSPPGVGDVGAPSPDTAIEAVAIDPSAVPETADGYVISLPPDLPPDIEVNESYSAQIKQFAFENKLPQGFMNKMAAAVVRNDLAKIAADKQAFTDQANSVIAATSAARVQAVGSFLEKTAPSAAAALKSSMLKGGPDAVRFFEAAAKAMGNTSSQTRSGPIEMVRGIFFP